MKQPMTPDDFEAIMDAVKDGLYEYKGVPEVSDLWYACQCALAAWRNDREPMESGDADDLQRRLEAELDEAEAKAWDSLGRYKFQMFGYWAAIWVHLNRIGGRRRQNPWRELVIAARDRQAPAEAAES